MTATAAIELPLHAPVPVVDGHRATPRRRTPASWWIVLGVVVATGLVVRVVYDLRHGGPVYVHGYDSGVYYAAADALIHGRLPYHSFLFLETPGVALVVAPFAWLGAVTRDSVGFAAANLAFTGIGAASSGMVAVILRRFGLPAALFGGLFYAVTDAVVSSEQFIKLEPAATLLILIALALLGDVGRSAGRRRTLVAGILLGLACGFKIWYIVPALVVLAVVPGRRRLGVLVGGAVGMIAIFLPFFVAAPATMIREVIVDQLGRGRMGVSLMGRLHAILGNNTVPVRLSRVTGLTVGEVTGALAILCLFAVILALRNRSARLYAYLFLSGGAVLWAAPSFFTYYTSLTSAPLALVIGVAFASLLTVFASRRGRVAMTALALAGLAAINIPGQWRASTGGVAPLAGLRQAAAQVQGCVVSDTPEILIAMNVLTHDLDEGCTVWPDVSGWTYDPSVEETLPDGHHAARAENQNWQKRIVGYLTSGSAMIAYRPETGLDARSEKTVTSGPLLFHDGSWRLYATPRHIEPGGGLPVRP